MEEWLLEKEGMEEILDSGASTFLAAIGKTQQMQQGTSGRADFVDGERDSLLLPPHAVAAPAFSQSVPRWL